MKKKHLFEVLALCATLTMAAGAHAQTTERKVVRDQNGEVVHAIGNGSCVRTNWEANGDPCAPAAAEPAPQKQVRTMLTTDEKTVYFEFDKSTLTPEAQQRLDVIADRLKSAKDVRAASIVGFADRKGTPEYNQKLSEARALTVKNYLSQKGYLNTEVAKVRAVGESQPSTDCKEASRAKEIACLAPDRKVEVELQYVDTKTVMKKK